MGFSTPHGILAQGDNSPVLQTRLNIAACSILLPENDQLSAFRGSKPHTHQASHAIVRCPAAYIAWLGCMLGLDRSGRAHWNPAYQPPIPSCKNSLPPVLGSIASSTMPRPTGCGGHSSSLYHLLGAECRPAEAKGSFCFVMCCKNVDLQKHGVADYRRD